MNPERPKESDTLESLLRHLDGNLGPDETAALAGKLRSDGEARRQAARLLLQVGHLGELRREAPLPAGRAPAPRPASPPSPPKPLRWVAGALAFAGAAAAASLLLPRAPRERRGPEERASAPAAGAASRSPAARGTERRALPPPAFARPPAAPAETRPESATRAAGGRVAVLVRGSDPVGAELDRLIERRLEAMGFEVAEVSDERVQREDLAAAAVVVLSSSTTGPVLEDRLPRLGLRDLPVPVVSCENASYALLGMTGPRTSRQRGAAPRKLTVEIEPTGHPMAAGLPPGRARLADAPVSLSWGEPGEAATKIATLEGSRHRRAVLFGYEREAAMMPGLTAPARRVGCFLVPAGAAAVSETGWQLFDAAVSWAAGL